MLRHLFSIGVVIVELLMLLLLLLMMLLEGQVSVGIVPNVGLHKWFISGEFNDGIGKKILTIRSVTRWLDYCFIIFSFGTMEMSPIMLQIYQIRLNNFP